MCGTAGDGDDREDIKPKGPHCRPLHPARIFEEDILLITSLFGNMNYEATNSPSVTFIFEAIRDSDN
jgi:hypothetical protein